MVISYLIEVFNNYVASNNEFKKKIALRLVFSFKLLSNILWKFKFTNCSTSYAQHDLAISGCKIIAESKNPNWINWKTWLSEHVSEAQGCEGRGWVGGWKLNYMHPKLKENMTHKQPLLASTIKPNHSEEIRCRQKTQNPL